MLGALEVGGVTSLILLDALLDVLLHELATLYCLTIGCFFSSSEYILVGLVLAS